MKIYPLFIPHQGCPFQCVFCNQIEITKTKRPHFADFEHDLKAFCHKHVDKKKEIAFFGGTFTSLPLPIQTEYLNYCSQLLDENTAIRISTRPDAITPENLIFLKKYGVQTIELGIQSFDDEVLKASKRGYNSKTAIEACNLISESGFDLGIQLMPGLPGERAKTINLNISHTLNLKPSCIRIYPTIVIKETALASWFKQGSYRAMNLEDAINVTAEMKLKFDEAGLAVIKMGLHADMDPEAIIAGPYHPAFGELVRAKMLETKILDSFQANFTLHISPHDVSLFKGFKSEMLNRLKIELKIDKLPIVVDSNLTKNNFNFQESAPETWY